MPFSKDFLTKIADEKDLTEQQKQLLNNYYAANKLLVDRLRESNASPEVQKEIQETLLLPIAEIERRKSDITKKIILDCPQEINASTEVKDTEETLLLPTVQLEKRSNNEVQQQVQNKLPLPTDEVAQPQRENKQISPKLSVKLDKMVSSLFPGLP